MNNLDEQLLVDFINGELSQEEAALVLSKIDQQSEWKDKYNELDQLKSLVVKLDTAKPSEASQKKFDKFLSELEEASPKPKPVMRNLLKWGLRAAVIIGVGYFGVWMFNQNEEQGKENMVLDNFVQLTERESTMDKIHAIQIAYDLEPKNEMVLNTLLGLMFDDPSPNVRIAAINALVELDPNSMGRHLLDALKSEKTPNVQIVLIESLVKVKSETSKQTIQQIEKNNQFDDDVLQELEVMKFELTKM